jgi:hypothetical protein
MASIKTPALHLARPVPLACFVTILEAYSLSNAQIKLNAQVVILMILHAIKVCISVPTLISVFNVKRVNTVSVALSVETAQLATYAMLAPRHPPLTTCVLKTTIACMELDWLHPARVAHSALSKVGFRAPTALPARLDRYALETRSLKIALLGSIALWKLEKRWLVPLVHMVTKLS